MQITTGIRSMLSHPIIYNALQNIMGARQGWRRIVNEYLKLKPGDAILDVGCGPGDLLDYLPQVNYWGFDISAEYIAHAKKKYGARGNFCCKLFEEGDLPSLPKFDAILLSGVLHHLDDKAAIELLELLRKALKPEGRLITVDPCLDDGQNFIARFLILRDRGQNVRDKTGYEQLVQNKLNHVRTSVYHKKWIPYTNCYIECKKTS